jgi:branched-chain amino acid transport system substrate-binding protein
LFGGAFGSVINFASEQGYKPQWLFASISAQQGMIGLLKPEVKKGIIFPTVYALDDSLGAPGWKDWAQAATAAGIPAKSAGSVEGYARAEIFTEALRRAGKDLTREKIIKAVESLNGWKCSVCLEPLQFSATDHTAFSNVTLIESTDGGWSRVK